MQKRSQIFVYNTCIINKYLGSFMLNRTLRKISIFFLNSRSLKCPLHSDSYALRIDWSICHGTLYIDTRYTLNHVRIFMHAEFIFIFQPPLRTKNNAVYLTIHFHGIQRPIRHFSVHRN